MAEVRAGRVWAIASLAGCVALVACLLMELRAGAVASKAVASTAFLLVAYTSGAFRSRYGRILFIGLVFSWFGDMFLIGMSAQLFLAGLVSFLLAHIAYVIAFSVNGLNDRWTLSAVIPVAAISLFVSAWLAPYLPEDMIVPVRVYTFVISVMVVTSFGTRGAGGPWLIPLGATLFYLSDLSVATLRFTEPEFPTYVWGLPFYYAGQILLALSVAFASRGSR